MTKISSMTGFGRATGTIQGVPVTLEIKSLNHRFLDFRFRIPRDWQGLEPLLRTYFQSHLKRGSIDFHVAQSASTSTDQKRESAVVPNFELIQNWIEAARQITEKTGIPNSLSISDIFNRPGALVDSSRLEDFDSAKVWEEFKPCLDQATQDLVRSRSHEGLILKKAFLEGVDACENWIHEIQSLRNSDQAQFPSKIKDRVKKMLDSVAGAISATELGFEARLAQEVAMIWDRTDIEEELVRFNKHLTHLKTEFLSDQAVGRKIEFILQELHREINTLSNKAQNSEISERAIQIKVRIEQMREQGMNLE